MNLSIDWLLDQNLRPMINDYGSKGIELASILPLREAVVEIIELFLKTPYESVDAFVQEAMQECPQIQNKKFLSILAMGLFAKERELRHQYVQKILKGSSKLSLQDFNYSYSVVLASSSLNEMQTKLVNIELYLKNNETGRIERLVLELTQEELSDFIEKLEPFERILNATM